MIQQKIFNFYNIQGRNVGKLYKYDIKVLRLGNMGRIEMYPFQWV